MLDFTSFIIAAIQKAILAIDAIDNDLFNAVYFPRTAIGDAQADVLDAMKSMQSALSWAENGADLRSENITKWKYPEPFDVALKLLNMAQMIVIQQVRPKQSITEDEHPPVFNTAQEAMLKQSISAINKAVCNIEQVQKQKDSGELKKAVNA